MSDTKDRPYTADEVIAEAWFGGQRERVLATVAEVERAYGFADEVKALRAELAAANQRALMAQLDDSKRDELAAVIRERDALAEELREAKRFGGALEAWDSAVKAACRGVGGLPDHMLAHLAALKARRSP